MVDEGSTTAIVCHICFCLLGRGVTCCLNKHRMSLKQRRKTFFFTHNAKEMKIVLMLISTLCLNVTI